MDSFVCAYNELTLFKMYFSERQLKSSISQCIS